MYNITIPQNSSSNCYDTIFYSLLKYYNFEYEAYNIEYFYTDYYDNMYSNICRGKFHVNSLKDIYNIDLIFTHRNESCDLYKIVRNSLDTKPIGIIIDPYHCYWSPFFQQAHFFHMVLIVGIDYCNKQYICFDVHYGSTGYMKVDFDVINNNFMKYFIIDFKEVNRIQPELIINKINASVNNFDYNIDSKKVNLLNYFRTSDRETLFPNGIKTSIMLINIMWIAEDKKNSRILFKYIEDKINKNVFSYINELLSISEQKFILLKTTLIKYAITGVLNYENLKNIIDKIYDIDLLIINQMKNVLGDIL